MSTCNLEHWREILAGILTYNNGAEMNSLCNMLGSRLEFEATDQGFLNACICYISSSNIDNLVTCWEKVSKTEFETGSSASLQDLVEKIMTLKYCFQNVHPELNNELLQSMTKLNSKLVEYAKLLADQGCFINAYSYLNDSNDVSAFI